MCQAAPPLYAGAVHRSPAVASRSAARKAEDYRRGPERARSALGVPLPPALPTRDAALRARGAGAQGDRATACRCLSSLLRGAVKTGNTSQAVFCAKLAWSVRNFPDDTGEWILVQHSGNPLPIGRAKEKHRSRQIGIALRALAELD